MFKKLTLAITSFFIFSTLWAHGDDKPGPNGGYIYMPGPFHTEIVPNTDKRSFRIFLLDLNFKDPVVKNSKVSASIKQGTKTTEASCKEQRIFFDCALPGGITLNEGELIVKSNRLGIFDGVSIYPLPLKGF